MNFYEKRADEWRRAEIKVFSTVEPVLSFSEGGILERRLSKVNAERQPRRSTEFTATIWREDDGYVALCPELDIASQGDTVEEARANLQEAVDLFFEAADASEVAGRLKTEVYVTTLEVTVGETP